MDPDTTLAALRQWVSYDKSDRYIELQAKELFEALDEWISNGGFLPRDWRWTTDDRISLIPYEDTQNDSEA